MPLTQTPPDRIEKDHPQQRLPLALLVVICVGYFLVILDATVVNVALPAIGRGLHAGSAPACSGSWTRTRCPSPGCC